MQERCTHEPVEFLPPLLPREGETGKEAKPEHQQLFLTLLDSPAQLLCLSVAHVLLGTKPSQAGSRDHPNMAGFSLKTLPSSLLA